MICWRGNFSIADIAKVNRVKLKVAHKNHRHLEAWLLTGQSLLPTSVASAFYFHVSPNGFHWTKKQAIRWRRKNTRKLSRKYFLCWRSQILFDVAVIQKFCFCFNALSLSPNRRLLLCKYWRIKMMIVQCDSDDCQCLISVCLCSSAALSVLCKIARGFADYECNRIAVAMNLWDFEQLFSVFYVLCCVLSQEPEIKQWKFCARRNSKWNHV